MYANRTREDNVRFYLIFDFFFNLFFSLPFCCCFVVVVVVVVVLFVCLYCFCLFFSGGEGQRFYASNQRIFILKEKNKTWK